MLTKTGDLHQFPGDHTATYVDSITTYCFSQLTHSSCNLPARPPHQSEALYLQHFVKCKDGIRSQNHVSSVYLRCVYVLF